MNTSKMIQLDIVPPMKLTNCSLEHAGQTSARSKNFIPDHYHGPRYELTVVTSGRGICYADKKAPEVKKGDIYVSFPFEYHRVDSSEDDLMHYVFITFSVSSELFVDKLKKLWADNIPPENRIFHNDQIKIIIDNVISEVQNPSDYYHRELLSAMMDTLIIYIIRSFSDRIPNSLPPNPTEAELCAYISHYIDTHLYSIRQLCDISEVMSYSYGYLSSIFTRVRGLTISDYYLSKRMEMAKILISENILSLSEISEDLHYSGIYSFSKAFKNYYGISPRKYHNSLKNKSI